MHAMEWDRVLSFWFGALDEHDRVDPAVEARWWRADPAFDAEITSRFLGDHQAICAGEREAWLAEPRGRLAYVIVLDQFSRNMFRGTAAMFASDGRALAAAHAGVERGDDQQLPGAMRAFLYMPFMHSESLPDQERSVALFRALAGGADDARLEFAIRHRDIVARFGRFPHRNAILGRPTTAEEAEFLTRPGSSF